MNAKLLPWGMHVPSLVLIAQAVFFLECRHTQTHKVTEHSEHITHKSATVSVAKHSDSNVVL